MTEAPVRVSPAWLALREPADACARNRDLIEQVRARLPAGRRTVIHDLACGTGSMARWLVPQLTGRQHWILYDRDPELLAHAEDAMARLALTRTAVTFETRQRDVTRLAAAELADASLITSSALLDMLTEDEVERFVASCAAAGCPSLVTISVTGHVDLTPFDSLDKSIEAAFNAHQRRVAQGRRLLGPDAVQAAVDAFARRGSDVIVRSSPWQLSASQIALTEEWLRGWVDAACEQQPELAATASCYLRRRLADLNAGRLNVTVDHHDFLAAPPSEVAHR